MKNCETGTELVQKLFAIEQNEGLHTFLGSCQIELEAFRQRVPKGVWQTFVASDAASALRGKFLDDPYTRRGFEKPRGYAGDAVLLDFIYGAAPLPEDTPKRGLRINEWMCSESEAFAAVRSRRLLCARYIDEAVARDSTARVLSVACGHLREYALCRFDRTLWRGELVALDQDRASLAVVSSTYGDGHVRTRRAAISSLLDGSVDIGKFDLIYSAGLLDYLDDRLVTALATWCIDALNPGGKLLLANFTGCGERGYMEGVMHWPLVYRTEKDLRRLLPVPACTFLEDSGVIAYGEITKDAVLASQATTRL